LADAFEVARWADDVTMMLSFRGNLVTEYWEEYVAYDYYDWCGFMGGMLSISLILFFKGAYLMAKICGEKNAMGILPEMSLVFKALEVTESLKERILRDYIHKSLLLPDTVMTVKSRQKNAKIGGSSTLNSHLQLAGLRN